MLTGMGRGASVPLELSVRVVPDGHGLHLYVESCTDGRRLEAARADLSLRIWSETTDVIRISLVDGASGRIAMLQGNDALRRLALAVHLVVR
jgi:hypothetical protein